MNSDKPAGRPGYRPSHPGRIIKRNLDALGMTIEAFAEHIGTSRQTVHTIIAGRSEVRAEMAVRLARAFNTTPQFWLRMQINHTVWEIERKMALLYRIRPLSQRPPKPQPTARRRAARRAPGITRAH
jgi:antitoxin HigA-1